MKKYYLISLLIMMYSLGVMANPIIISDWSHAHIQVLVANSKITWQTSLAIALLAIALEFAFLLTFSKFFKIYPKKLFIVFPLVHLLTFPITQYLAIWMMYFSEIFPIVVETIIYRKFGVFTQKNKLNWLAVTLANFISWLIGFIFIGLHYEQLI